jgi:hypothetical protein
MMAMRIRVIQDSADINEIADTMVRLCLGGGRSEAVNGGGTGADLSRRALDVKGNTRASSKSANRVPRAW